VNLHIVTPALVAFVVSAITTGVLCSPLARIVGLDTLDHPNERSLHSRPTPRTGGLAIAGGVASALIAFLALFHGVPPWIETTLMCSAFVAVVSFYDDRRGLSPFIRLPLQVVAAALLSVGGVSLSRIAIPGFGTVAMGSVAAAVSTLFVVWMANLYNFMDGMDGLSGGMAVVGFGLAGILVAGHDATFSAFSFAIAGSAAGFLLYNLPPARIFMGDVGSVPLGFLAGALAVRAAETRIMGFGIFVLLFSPFVVDATIVLIRRLWNREHFWRPHRAHAYQRLVLAGWSHRKTLVAEYSMMFACGATALAASHGTEAQQLGLLAGWAVIYVVLYRLVGTVERRASRLGQS
jgi:UDP-N-acetylmuramyl pentapeptide phosphotransferase/UDP-N-acetylglucosamine-1-phosphate transferase